MVLQRRLTQFDGTKELVLANSVRNLPVVKKCKDSALCMLLSDFCE
jgi:hypothetical protein